MNKIYKSVLGVAAAAIVGCASMAPVAVYAWGDSSNGRATYTLDQINSGKLGDTITFNSITNGKIGDERNFVGAKTNINASTWNADTISVKDGDVVTIRLYVHNNSPKAMAGIATGVSASFSLPTTVSTSHTVVGYLNAANATPNRYWDEVKLTSSENFYIEYVNGSAQYRNTQGTFNIPDSVITSGATLGYTTMDGRIPGCYDYDGELTIQVKVHSSVTARVSKQVRMKGTKTWGESVTANLGDEVEFQIEYVNLLADTVSNVMIRDVLPTNLQYVPDSTYLYNAKYQSGVKLAENTVTTSGINIGSYTTDGNAYVRFTAKVVDSTLACGKNQLVNWASSTVNGKVTKDDASVFVTKSGATCTSTNNNTTNVVNPERIVNTGPEMVITGAIGAGSAVTALGYFIASRKRA